MVYIYIYIFSHCGPCYIYSLGHKVGPNPNPQTPTVVMLNPDEPGLKVKG